MEPVGLGLGVVGLAGIFKSCVELFGYFSTYRSYGHDYNLLDAKLHVEKAVLLQWADRVRLLHEDYDQRLDDPVIRGAVFQVLASIIHLLSESTSLQQRYGMKQQDGPQPSSKPSTQATGGSLMKKLMDDYNAMQDRMSQQKATTSTSSKLKWIIADKDKFNTLIKQLSDFTSKLDVLLPAHSSEQAVSLLASLVRNEMASIYRENAKAALQRATDDRVEANAVLREARDQDRALKSLWFRCMGDRKDSVSSAHANTFEWALKPACQEVGGEGEWDDLSEWLQSGAGIYWVCGKAGSGKSTMMKYLHDNPDTRTPLKAWAGDLPLTVASFFFLGFGTQEQKSLEGLSRAILYQLMEAESSYLPSALPRLWQEVRANVHQEPKPPSSGELQVATEFLMERFRPNRRFCLFIDGLDEFEGNFHDAIRLIKGLSANSTIKIIVSSRPTALCYDAFSHVPQLHMETLTEKDIKEYIHDVVGSHPYMEALDSSGGHRPSQVTDKLVQKASGVFLWVILACRSILDGFAAHDTIEELCQRVDNLPPELESLFVHMLNSVDRRYHEKMAKTLKIVHMVSQNPYWHSDRRYEYGLPTLELACFDRDNMDCTLNTPLQSISTNDARKICATTLARLRSRCGGLLQARDGLKQGCVLNNSEIQICWCPLAEDCPRVSKPDMSSAPLKGKREDFPEHSRITFLHRTVVEFLNNAGVWDLGPLQISDSDFAPACAILSMGMQLTYLRCRNGRKATVSYGELLSIDDEPPNCVLPVLAKVADCWSLMIKQGHYKIEGAVQVCLSPFLSLSYDRSSPQLLLLLAVECDLPNTVSSILSTATARPLDPSLSPFPLLDHSVRSPLFVLLNYRDVVIFKENHARFRSASYLVSHGFSPNEVFVNEQGLFTTPWKELILVGQHLHRCPHHISTVGKLPPEAMYQFAGFRVPTFRLMMLFIEHGAELDNPLPGIPTMEEFFEDEFSYILSEDPAHDGKPNVSLAHDSHSGYPPMAGWSVYTASDLRVSL
ncbi:prion-inhibition and propagation-domain-containing protein [Sordaria brevicollis]|uniref:Prion-inhibition and propagation-domain-containing protein n=1 Tax=Sordaria brevicollis TaxID=83679 RepID=A0AAE0PC40_SORBR|nr:prion-inhibition and propagation-domain-containing protein [Sordaria brevicollis]